MQTGIPQLDQETYLSVKTLKDSAKVTRALQIAFDEAELGMKEQVELCGIPAPTFQEAAARRRDCPPNEGLRTIRRHNR